MKELSLKYGKTQNQIIFNWLHTRGFLPITKSETIDHINEYLDATQFKMDPLDIERINMFRPPNYIGPKVFYRDQGEGIRIDLLSNIFDEEYERQQQQLKK